ncbi:MAG: EpsG family protein, partial [Muribaculaceae bacterium]|nr:EpsG family protein [Muribaculaceae bacterium]
RNGLACSIVMFAISMLNKQEKKNFLYAALLLIAATGIHTSTFIPATALVLSVLLIKRTKTAIVIWLVSIVVSLVAGNSVIQLIPDFGLDMSRFDQYISNGEDSDVMQRFAHAGFRVDFLLYSAVPVLMVWYLTIKRNFNDFTYNVIANTYILTNSFWIIVIRAAYTNRFAYLSWFLYPIVIVYPLARMKVWENQNQKVAWILMAYVGFTVTMFLLGK